jgi:hypothetical protein
MVMPDGTNGTGFASASLVALRSMTRLVTTAC